MPMALYKSKKSTPRERISFKKQQPLLVEQCTKYVQQNKTNVMSRKMMPVVVVMRKLPFKKRKHYPIGLTEKTVYRRGV